MKINFISLIIIVILASCVQKIKQAGLIDKILNSEPTEKVIPGKPGIRGLDVFDAETVWLSGSKGIFAVSTDKGNTWKTGTINNDTLLDFRDIVAFGKKSAIALSAGSPARIYKTVDGGATWKLTYENNNPGIFFDSFEFWGKNNGIACADPLEGNFFFILTHDGGDTWEKIPNAQLPEPLNQEGGFAASGTCVALGKNGTAMFGTGGDKARIILTHDFGKSWKAVTTPVKANNPLLGIYSVAAFNEHIFAITGGNYQEPNLAESNFAITNDEGNTWKLVPTMPYGYRSCVKFFKTKSEIIVCGKTGVDISKDSGNSWVKTGLSGYYTLDISPDNKFIVFAGPDGKIAFY